MSSLRWARWGIAALLITGFTVRPVLGAEPKPMDAGSLRWFKGNLHAHSFWSDGHGFPEMIADWFKGHGYHFLAFTDHDRLQTGEKWVAVDPATPEGRALTDNGLLAGYQARFGSDWVERRSGNGRNEIRLRAMSEYRPLLEEAGRFLILSGEEIELFWGPEASRTASYMNAINLSTAIAPHRTSGPTAEAMNWAIRAGEALERATGRPVLLFLDHPNYQWNATAEDILDVENLRFMEIHTAYPSCNNAGDELHASVERIWDIVLTARMAAGQGLLYGLAGDDCHGYVPDDPLYRNSALPGRAWIMVRAADLTPEHILEAMERGDFYASTGVTVENIAVDPQGMALTIRPEPGVRYRTQFIGTREGYDRGSTPMIDPEGKPIRATRKYSPQIGRILAEVEGLQPKYAFASDELYVRAVVESDVLHPDPHRPGDRQKAWIQPVRVSRRHGSSQPAE